MDFVVTALKALLNETLSANPNPPKVIFRDTLGIYEPYGEIIRKPYLKEVATFPSVVNPEGCRVGGEAWLVLYEVEAFG
jgi:hypothetical protein